MEIIISSCVSIVVVTVTIIYSVKLQKKNMLDKLKLDVYKEFAQVLDKCSKSISSAQALIWGVRFHYSNQLIMLDLGLAQSPLKHNNKSIMQAHRAAMNEIANIIKAIDKYKILVIQFLIYNEAFSIESISFCKIGKTER